MRFWLTEVALLLLLALALQRGGQPEKRAAIAYLCAFLYVPVTRILFGQPNFLNFDVPLFTADSVVLAVLVWIALRANRWWPLWASALQLIVVVAHLAKLAEIRGMAGVYWGMTTIPTYLQFFVLLGGIRAHHSRLQKIGPYPDWRES